MSQVTPRLTARSLFLLLALLAACGRATVDPVTTIPLDSTRTTFRVLFIGNSLTYANDLPHALANIVSAAGDQIITDMVAYGDYALVDHYNGTSEARAKIPSRKWDYVVMQQGPSSVQLSRDTLIVGARLFNPSIRAAGAMPAMYMVWPSKDRLSFFGDVIESYRLAAVDINAAIFPVGAAWQAAWSTDPSLPLYSSDNFHPSTMGTYLAAIVMYEQITHRDARQLPAHAEIDGGLTASNAQFQTLQNAAHTTNAAYGLVTNR
ncbi:MAG: hypothetical protein ABIS27_04125 [Longimicrobiales bacterium]